jgi:hypothetical protein
MPDLHHSVRRYLRLRYLLRQLRHGTAMAPEGLPRRCGWPSRSARPSIIGPGADGGADGGAVSGGSRRGRGGAGRHT